MIEFSHRGAVIPDRLHFLYWSLCLGGLLVLAAACGRNAAGRPPFAPQDTLEKFRIDERFQIELFAAEPLLDGPVAMAFDEEGHIYVFESPVFPLKTADRSSVKRIEDTDGDGRPDRALPLSLEEQLPRQLARWRERRDQAVDSKGNWFATSPRSHIQFLAPGAEPRDISDHGESAPIFPITENPIYPVLTEADRTTSTFGIACYSNAGVSGFERAVLTAEPAHNLVHCDLVTETKSGLVARRAREQAEFLASRDSWFRPLSFALGPDGALYVIDYYAPVAGPTEVLEVGIKSSGYLYQKSGHGRIYKITPKAEHRRSPEPLADVEAVPSVEPVRESPTPALPRERDELEKLIADPTAIGTLQAAAVRALALFPGEGPATFVLAKWRSLTTEPRREALEALFREHKRLEMLLNAFEKGQIPLWCLDDEHRVRLLAGSDRTLAERARRLLEAHDAARDPVVGKYEAALNKHGDRDSGEMIYRRLCGRCHPFRGGNNYGPDLWTVSSRPPRRIMIDILLPSNAMAPGRELFMIDLKTGGAVEGVIGSGSAAALNILHDESRQETVLRQDIKRLTMSDFSAMPVDLASQISVQDMADLLRFLTTR